MVKSNSKGYGNNESVSPEGAKRLSEIQKKLLLPGYHAAAGFCLVRYDE
jgi:hypothetical protein